MSSVQDAAPSAKVFFTLPVETRTFPQFPKLLYDIRYMIWLEALSYERCLNIALDCAGDNTRSSRSYELELRMIRERMTEPITHPLLHTCTESRQIAKMVYRIQFSCRYCGEDTYFKLYICPELDILDIDWDMPSHFIEFPTDCYNQDRDRKGLLNVLLPCPFPGPFSLDLDWFPIDKDAAKVAVYRLRRVVLEGIVEATISSDQVSRENPSSVPRLGRGITLGHLTTDPRATDDLARLLVGRHGLSETKSKWQRLLDMVEIDQSKCNFEETIMLFRYGPYRHLPEARSVLPSVTGFWMVPKEAFQEGEGDGATDYVDLRNYPPELYVAHPGSTSR